MLSFRLYSLLRVIETRFEPKKHRDNSDVIRFFFFLFFFLFLLDVLVILSILQYRFTRGLTRVGSCLSFARASGVRSGSPGAGDTPPENSLARAKSRKREREKDD